MRYPLKSILLSLAVLLCAASFASAASFFDSDEPKAKKPATVQPYESPAGPRTPIYAPAAPKADVKKQAKAPAYAPEVKQPAQSKAQPYKGAYEAPAYEPKAAAGKQPAPAKVQPYKGTYEAPAYEPKAAAKKQPAPQPLAGRHVLRGNPDSRIYHAYDCQYYDSKSATVEFATARAAEMAGYRPCKVCEGREGAASAKRQQAQDQPASPRRAALHGNPSSKVVHGPSCKYYGSKAASESFATLEAARKAGYHLCTVCEGK